MAAEAIGESCWLWRLGRGPTEANARRVHGLYRRLRDASAAGRIVFLDAVPAYDSLAVHFNPLITDADALCNAVDAILNGDDAANAEAAASTTTLPTAYDGPDLQRVADHTGLSVAEVARRHAAPTYTVAAIGFLPHFPYLLGLDPTLATPRITSPRPRVPAGAVAIGHDQTGVYPQDSPGGWNLIGTTDPGRLTTLRPGDLVRFSPHLKKRNDTLFVNQKQAPPPEPHAAKGRASRPLLNIDLGERGADHAVDRQLAAHADLVNLACGGHAGDADSVARFSAIADQHGALVTAHLSYPDREHFGRQPMTMAFDSLARALDTQRALLPETDHVKLHGALYHAADTDPALADTLAEWLTRAGFTTVMTPDPGALADAARARGLAVLAEAFIDRRYHRDPATGRVGLVPRSDPAASLTVLPDALAQAHGLTADGTVALHPGGSRHALQTDTLCVHSDSPIALDLAAAVAKRLRENDPA